MRMPYFSFALLTTRSNTLGLPIQYFLLLFPEMRNNSVFSGCIIVLKQLH
jgi:hypothetical protein